MLYKEQSSLVYKIYDFPKCISTMTNFYDSSTLLNVSIIYFNILYQTKNDSPI